MFHIQTQNSPIRCTGCREEFERNESIVNANGETFHTKCFVCAQCFQAFKDGIYYQFEKRNYCEYDFQLLFAPVCRGCKNSINGRVIKAINFNWHPECFRCYSCDLILENSNGFVRNSQRPYCKDCHALEKKKQNNFVCNKCFLVIDDEMVRVKGETYHAYHFSCKSCGNELNAATAREIRGELYCSKCQDKLEIAVCAACHTQIDQERIVYALGKQWHVEHFACAKCEIPFNGSRHFEKRGLAYCETHYTQLFGNSCYVCNATIFGDAFSFMNKSWCVEHFCCYLCDELMDQKTKFYDLDSKPICKHCFEKLPSKVRSNILKSYETKEKDSLFKESYKFPFLRKKDK